MKNFFAKPHNILFTAVIVIFLQFLSAVFMTYIQTVGIWDSFSEWSLYIYMVYCAAFCIIAALFVIKNRKSAKIDERKSNKTAAVTSDNSITEVKIWFSAIFLYIFFEILFFVRLIYTAYNDISGFSLWGTNSTMTDSIYSLWDNLPVEKLYLCCALIFIVYCAAFILMKKKIYIIAAGINLLVSSMLIVVLPTSFTLDGVDVGVADVFAATAIKEIGTLLLLVNLLIYALYMVYKSDDK
ncbi:MAG: hypothetical protein FWD71_16755 [Oscillospiraceae bacterium]|nr:hypothetical protein [Oscillospiraceae bacterium]